MKLFMHTSLHSEDGMDEISFKNNIVELKNGKIDEFLINPSDFGIKGNKIFKR